MKEYKIDLSMYEGKVRELVSEAVQRKAFELGYGWVDGGKSLKLLDAPLLYLNINGFVTCGYSKNCSWLNSDKAEISAADFLAITPEDVKDEVIVTTEPVEWLLVTQGESRRLVPPGSSIHNTSSEPMNIEFFTRTVAERFLP